MSVIDDDRCVRGGGKRGMPRIEILEIWISERAEAKFWTHGIERVQVVSILKHRWISLKTRRIRAANHIVM